MPCPSGGIGRRTGLKASDIWKALSTNLEMSYVNLLSDIWKALSTNLEMSYVNLLKFGETLQITLMAIPSQDLWGNFEIEIF